VTEEQEKERGGKNGAYSSGSKGSAGLKGEGATARGAAQGGQEKYHSGEAKDKQVLARPKKRFFPHEGKNRTGRRKRDPLKIRRKEIKSQ